MDKELSKKMDRIIFLLETLVKQTRGDAQPSKEVRKLLEQAEQREKPKGYGGLESNLP